jgi:formylglycine-generating enzyme required for sulfatase activity
VLIGIGSATVRVRAGIQNEARVRMDAVFLDKISGLTGTPDNGQVTLNWIDPTDPDLDHIEISWIPGGETPRTVSAGTQTYTAANLINETAYTFTLVAVDTAGNRSAGETITEIPVFIPVSNITGVPLIGVVGINLSLSGTVSPANATNQTITWSVSNSGTTGAEITDGNKLTTTGAGTVVATATITNGRAIGTDYTQDFSISITPIPGARDTHTLCGVGVPFRYVPAGSFQRDGTAGNVSVITKGYWMGEKQVTQKLFQAVMGTNPSQFQGSMNPTDGTEIQEQRPVEQINWYAAIAFCNKLSILVGKQPVYSVSGVSDWENLDGHYDNVTGGDIPLDSDTNWDNAAMDTTKNGYRLPTEMEWMWAAMGATLGGVGVSTDGYIKAYAGSTEGAGRTSIGNYAWYGRTGGNSNSKTHEVGEKIANELGLYDMSGNVWEWCWDWYGSYPSGNQTDYKGSSSGADRVLRGSAWDSYDYESAVAARGNNFPGKRADSIGFRVVCP